MIRNWQEIQSYMMVQGLATEDGHVTDDGAQVIYMGLVLMAARERIAAELMREGHEMFSQQEALLTHVCRELSIHPEHQHAIWAIIETMPDDE